MPSLREKSGRWYISVCQRGRRREIAVGNNERLARLRLAEIEAQIERGKAGFAIEVPPTLAELAERWLAGHGTTLAPRTLLRCRQYAVHALRVLDGKRPLAAEDVRKFQASRLQEGARAKTVNNEVAWLQQIARREDGTLGWKPIPKLKIRDARPVRWLTLDEIGRLLEAAIPRARPYLLGYLYTGARRDELVTVRWQDVDLVRMTIRLHNLKTAGRNPGDEVRTIPLHPDLVPVLRAAQAAALPSPWPRPQDSHRMRTWVIRAAAAAKILPRPTLHDLRHTYASHLAQAGVDLRVIKDLLGHTTIQTTMRYSHLTPTNYAQAVGLLKFLP
jgi:integrase